MATLPHGDPFVVEIGSNDGTLLRHVATAGIRHLGIEPSANVAQAATARRRQHGLRVLRRAARQRRSSRSTARPHAIIAANAMSHSPTCTPSPTASAILLAPDGICVFEDPYWGDIVAQTAFDQIYDEHAFYFSLSSVSHLFAQHGLEVFDVDADPTSTADRCAT